VCIARANKLKEPVPFEQYIQAHLITKHHLLQQCLNFEVVYRELSSGGAHGNGGHTVWLRWIFLSSSPFSLSFLRQST